MYTHPNHTASQRGFSLIEMAIVLVIASLLIAGIMNASSIINKVKIDQTITMYKDISSALVLYKQKLKSLPGDNPLAATDLPVSGIVNGDGDGYINETESDNVFKQLFVAGFLREGEDGIINSPFGRIRVVDNSIVITTNTLCGTSINSTAPAPVLQSVLLINNPPANIAAEIDKIVDDGVFNTGRVRGSSTYTNLATTISCIALPLQ